MAAAGSSGAAAAEVVGDGPVVTMMNKRLRALRKKYNRILQMEESLAQGKTLNKEQEEVFRSKPAIAALIEEYERLRQPLSAALQEELALARLSSAPPSSPSPPPPSAEEDEQDRNRSEEAAADSDVDRRTEQEPQPDRESAVEDLINLLYFGCLFDVKSQSEFASMVFTRMHERESCLTYDYVTDDSTGFLLEGDLDLLSNLATLLISRPANSGDSHRNALLGCVQRAKLWLTNSEQPVLLDSSITYAGLRERLKRILSSEYFTKAPEMKAPEDVAVAVGKYQVQASSTGSIAASAAADAQPVHYQEKEERAEGFESSGAVYEQSDPVIESPENESNSLNSAGDTNAVQPEQRSQNQRDFENLNEQQYGHRRPYQNHRGGGRGVGRGRRDFVNGRGGGRGARGGGGASYQGGRSQYYDSGYYPRNYHNPRGRGGRGGGPAAYGHAAAADVELQASS